MSAYTLKEDIADLCNWEPDDLSDEYEQFMYDLEDFDDWWITDCMSTERQSLRLIDGCEYLQIYDDWVRKFSVIEGMQTCELYQITPIGLF